MPWTGSSSNILNNNNSFHSYRSFFPFDEGDIFFIFVSIFQERLASAIHRLGCKDMPASLRMVNVKIKIIGRLAPAQKMAGRQLVQIAC